jgi:hypothetical protein
MAAAVVVAPTEAGALMSTRPAPSRLALRPDEAAAMLGISRALFYRDVLPHLRCVYLGRVRLIAVVELERWLEKEAVR